MSAALGAVTPLVGATKSSGSSSSILIFVVIGAAGLLIGAPLVAFYVKDSGRPAMKRGAWGGAFLRRPTTERVAWVVMFS